MISVRYLVLVLLACAPTLALAQQDSVVVRTEGGDLAYPAYPALFGQSFEQDVSVGPAPMSIMEPSIGCEEDPDDPGVFIPVVDNPEEVEGSIVLISRGACAFVLKVEAASSAGAIGVIVYNDDRVPPDDENLVNMSGDCDPDVCSAPAVFVSRVSGLSLIQEAKEFGEAVLDPVRIRGPIEPPCPPYCPYVPHNTGVVQFDVTGYGFLGADANFGGFGFVFNGENGLFVSTVLVGVDGNVVTNPYDGLSEWTTASALEPIGTPFPSPFTDYDQGWVTAYSSDDLGVFVTQRSYSRDGDPYVVVELEVENVTGDNIEDAYIGILADWDAGETSLDDFGGVNENLNVPYVYDADMDQYYGVAVRAYDEVLSGYSLDATTADDAQLWEALTTAVPPADGPAERVAVTGTGPYDIPPGASVTVPFLFVAGASEAEFFANATPPLMPSTEPSASADGFVLAPVYPNPTASDATVRLDLATAQAVRVAVFDVLGRRVAVLHDGPLGAGAHRLDLDASALPIGTYFVRVEAGGMQRAQPFTVVR